jgi:hypothetical protein
MKKHSLSTKGLSLSQAQSISNLCHQACRDIDAKLVNINNAGKVLKIDGVEYVETPAHPITGDIPRMLSDKSAFHATQSFLMENIKTKQEILDKLQQDQFSYDDFDMESPEYPDLEEFEPTPLVGESWGWMQLSTSEYNEYLEAEAFASHFGQFIHKGGKLDVLRRELPTLKTLEWMVIEDGKKTPLQVNIHHSIDQLGQLHEELSAIHRAYEQRVNYFKAKVKNLVTQENARISRENADRQAEINKINDDLISAYEKKREQYTAAFKQARMEFEEQRQKSIQETANLRILVDDRFKPVIDRFLKDLG